MNQIVNLDTGEVIGATVAVTPPPWLTCPTTIEIDPGPDARQLRPWPKPRDRSRTVGDADKIELGNGTNNLGDANSGRPKGKWRRRVTWG